MLKAVSPSMHYMKHHLSFVAYHLISVLAYPHHFSNTLEDNWHAMLPRDCAFLAFRSCLTLPSLELKHNNTQVRRHDQHLQHVRISLISVVR
jgi:hypothetical protein